MNGLEFRSINNFHISNQITYFESAVYFLFFIPHSITRIILYVYIYMHCLCVFVYMYAFVYVYLCMCMYLHMGICICKC